MISPTVAISPPRVSDVNSIETYRPKNIGALRNTCAANYLGLCAITLPVGLDQSKMPVGLQLIAPRLHEETLLAIATCLENILGNAAQRLGTPPGLKS